MLSYWSDRVLRNPSSDCRYKAWSLVPDYAFVLVERLICYQSRITIAYLDQDHEARHEMRRIAPLPQHNLSSASYGQEEVDIAVEAHLAWY